MKNFKRAFGLTFSVIILLLFLVFAFELINSTIEKSGFSSGEVIVLELSKNIFSGEILGRKFSADFSPVISFLPRLRVLRFFIPPFIRLGVLVFGFIV